MIINPYIFSRGYLVYLIRGDSIAAGQGEVAGPTTTPGIIYEWDDSGGVLVDRYNTEFSTVGVAGSPWKKMGIDLNATTGKKIVFICCGLSGAEVFPNGGTDTHWAPNYDNAGSSVPGGTGSVLYTSSVSKTANCLAYLGKSSLDGICDIVGINDVRGSASLANIALGFTSLYDNTNTDFPGVPIYACSVGREETATVIAKGCSVKKNQRQLADARSYYNIVCNLLSLCEVGWQMYKVDNLHPTQAGNNQIGSMYARYIGYSESNKEVKQVWNSFKSALTTAHKAAWKTWVEALQSAGIWDELEAFFPAVGDARADVVVDVRALGFAADAGFTFTANDAIRLESTTKYRRMNTIPASSWIGASQNDFIVGSKVKTNHTAAGTNGYLFGLIETSATRQTVLAQLNTNVISYIANDNTSSTYATQTAFQSNSIYSVYRNGTTKGMYIDDTSVASVTQASTGQASNIIYEGARNNSNTPGTALDVEIEYSFQAKYTGFNMTDFKTATDALITALKTP